MSKTDTTKTIALDRTAADLRMTIHQVQTVVDHYEKNRSAVNRERTAAAKAKAPAKSKAANKAKK